MPLRITLSDQEVIEVDLPLEEWNRAFQSAVQGNTMLEIQEPGGHILSLNPQTIIKLEVSPQRQEQLA